MQGASEIFNAMPDGEAQFVVMHLHLAFGENRRVRIEMDGSVTVPDMNVRVRVSYNYRRDSTCIELKPYSLFMSKLEDVDVPDYHPALEAFGHYVGHRYKIFEADDTIQFYFPNNNASGRHAAPFEIADAAVNFSLGNTTE